jgi:peroxiredoxin
MLGKLFPVKGSLLLAFLLLFMAMDILLPASSPALIGIKEGDEPKRILLNDLDGKNYDIGSLFGKNPIILVFWELPLDNSFLDYSLDELKFMNDIYKKHHDRSGLEIIGIYTPVEDKEVSESELSKVRNLISLNKLQFPIVIDKGLKFYKEYGVIALPSTVMIGKQGKIDFIYPSFPSSAETVVSVKVRELIGVAEVQQDKKQTKQKKSDSQSHRLYHYGLQMYKRGLLEQAYSSVQKSIDLDPDYPYAHNLMGIILWKRGMFDRSMKEFKTAIELDNKNIAAHLNYAVLLYEQGQFRQAETVIKSSPSTQSEFKVRAHYMLGLVYKNTARIDESIKELDLAFSLLEVMSSDTADIIFSFKIPILRDLSELYSKKGNDKKAVELLQQAVQIAIGIEAASDAVALNRRRGIMIYE